MKKNYGPRYANDCAACTFLGRCEKWDLYFCFADHIAMDPVFRARSDALECETVRVRDVGAGCHEQRFFMAYRMAWLQGLVTKAQGLNANPPWWVEEEEDDEN